jgi:hypothetical protein
MCDRGEESVVANIAAGYAHLDRIVEAEAALSKAGYEWKATDQNAIMDSFARTGQYERAFASLRQRFGVDGMIWKVGEWLERVEDVSRLRKTDHPEAVNSVVHEYGVAVLPVVQAVQPT